MTFHSSDEELHNINVKDSETREPEFNVAITPDGTYQHTFKRAGFYDVHCDVHPAMSAQIIVTDTPFATTADRDGHFVFEDVPAGLYRLSVYAGAAHLERPVQVSSGRTEVHVE